MIPQLAQAVADDLKTATLGMPAEVLRLYVPNVDPEEISELRLSVVPRGIESETLTRGADIETYRVDIAVQKRLGREPNEVDDLLAVVRAVRQHVRRKRYTIGNVPFKWVKTENVPIYVVEHLRKGVFTSVVTLTFESF